MLQIHQALQNSAYPNCSKLAREMEISSKSIQRDLEFMRYSLGLPIAWDARRNGFFYTEEVNDFPTLQISEGELLAMVVAEKALHQYRGTPFEKPLVGAIKKLTQTLPDTISLDLSEAGKSISFVTRIEPVLDLKIFDKLAKATVARQQLELTYRKPGQQTPELRLVDPYHLANINGEWYLFAYDHLRKDIRTFAPARIKEVRETSRTFPRPDRFSLNNRLRGSFGVHSGKGSYRVVLEFASRAADIVREKKWHDSQKIEQLPDGKIRLILKLSSLAEVERWVLGWGGDALVIEPAELLDNVRMAATRLLKSTTPPHQG